MFDPVANADYAARFLRDLHAETGDWIEAAGLYHSRTPKFRDRYAARFARILGDRGGLEVASAPAPPPEAEAPAPPRDPGGVWRVAAIPPTPGAVALAAVAEAPAPGATPADGALIGPARGPLLTPARSPLVAPAARRLID
jgi:soluble lytic murein transglycosylase-like protein